MPFIPLIIAPLLSGLLSGATGGLIGGSAAGATAAAAGTAATVPTLASATAFGIGSSVGGAATSAAVPAAIGTGITAAAGGFDQPELIAPPEGDAGLGDATVQKQKKRRGQGSTVLSPLGASAARPRLGASTILGPG